MSYYGLNANENDDIETIPVEELIRETPKAWLVKLREGEQVFEEWFPKSNCSLSSDGKSIEVPTWLLDSKGIT